ncbi:MAG: glycosyltransferase family 4 protein [Verrucomicrobiota bacterium]|jgi:glycosyltransferase involved in cell wall biosynthesis
MALLEVLRISISPTFPADRQTRNLTSHCHISTSVHFEGLQPRFAFSHPTGNANVRAVLAGFYEAGILGEFHTTIASYPGNVWDSLGKIPWGRQFKRRAFDERLRPLTVQHPFRELARMLAGRLGLHHLCRHETGVFSIDAVYQALDKMTAKHLRKWHKLYTGVYTYEDGALETLTAARELNLKRIYDLPIAYWQTVRRLLEEEAERLPAWKITLGGGVVDSERKLNRKTRELELSELVICPSQFVARSLPETIRKQKKVVVAPFGSPTVSPRLHGIETKCGKKLKVLFAGSMSQRKGLGDLFAAMRLLKRNDVELVIMGAPQASLAFYRKEFDGFIHQPSLPHVEVLQLMRRCDVFCLPSIAEGRALVLQEAMSQGLPLIITANTGGEDLIEDGVTGFLVPIRRADKIAEKIAWFADHRPELLEMSKAAQTKASHLTWEMYGKTIAGAILDLDRS